jgi:hypothetical protein
MATKTAVWQVTIQYTDGSTHVESMVRNMTSAGAERLVSIHCADADKTIAQVTSVQTGAKFAGEA